MEKTYIKLALINIILNNNAKTYIEQAYKQVLNKTLDFNNGRI